MLLFLTVVQPAEVLTLRGVVKDGSTIGLGRLDCVGSTTLAHCAGRPTNAPRTGSYPVCTRCSKLDGTDINGLFFFFENITSKSTRIAQIARNTMNPALNSKCYSSLWWPWQLLPAHTASLSYNQTTKIHIL